MNEEILKELKNIEERFHVKILYAVESGSRAWGFPSKDSDYDVRFIYIHQPDWYLAIDPQGVGKKRDVIELPINDLLDISGWEMTKALRLFRKSNPSLLEWTRSNIVYLQKGPFINRMRTLENEVFYPHASLHHYLNMAENNYRGHLQATSVNIKKCFYAIRPILACKWIEEKNTIPPIDFHTLLQMMLPDGELKAEIQHLLQRKIAGDELDFEPKIQMIHDFLDYEIDRLEDYIRTIEVEIGDPTPQLDTLFRKTLTEEWS